MANIRKLLLWKTTLKGIANTEAVPDVHVPPGPIADALDATTKQPTSWISYTGGGYHNEQDESGYYFAQAVQAQDPDYPNDPLYMVSYAEVDPTLKMRTTYSNWTITGWPSFEAQNKDEDSFPYDETNRGEFTGVLENWKYSQPLDAPWVSSAAESWGSGDGIVYVPDDYTNSITVPSLFGRFFHASFIQPATELESDTTFNLCKWPLSTSNINDPWFGLNPDGTGANVIRGFNWKYRYLNENGTLGWTDPKDSSSLPTGDTFRHTKTVPNTASLTANYYVTTYSTDTPKVWNEYEGATLTTGDIPGWELWNDGSDFNYSIGDVSGIYGTPPGRKDKMSAGLPQLLSPQGNAVNIAFEIELALHRYGAAFDAGYNVTNGNGNYGNNIAYRAGQFTFNDEEYIANKGSHLLVPCYIYLEPVDSFSGVLPRNMGGKLARYVIVALRLRQKYNPQTVITGSGVVLDAEQRFTNSRYSIGEAAAYNDETGAGHLPWHDGIAWAGPKVKLYGRIANSVGAPITCYRVSEDGRHHFISGGDRAVSTNTNQRSRCITKFMAGETGVADITQRRDQAYFGAGSISQTVRGRANLGWYTSGGEGYYKWGGASLDTAASGVQVGHLPDCDIFPGYNTSVNTKPPSYDPYTIRCFRWSHDGRFLYVMWDNCTVAYNEDLSNARKANSSSQQVIWFVERYYCSDPLKYNVTPGTYNLAGEQFTDGLYWCGRTEYATQNSMHTSKPDADYMYPPSSFEITPDGQYLQVLIDPFREGKPFITEHFLGGDDLRVTGNGSTDDAYDKSTSPEFAIANFSNGTWNKKINWPAITVKPGKMKPDPFPGDGVSNPSTAYHTWTYICLGWAWDNGMNYLSSLTSSVPTETYGPRREVNTYPCDFEWSVCGKVLYLFQRYRDSDYGNRKSGSDRGFMELDNQPVMMQVSTDIFTQSGLDYSTYPYKNTNSYYTGTAQSYLFHYTHRIANILRHTRDRYKNQEYVSSTTTAYTAYQPHSYKTIYESYSNIDETNFKGRYKRNRITYRLFPVTLNNGFEMLGNDVYWENYTDGGNYSATTGADRAHPSSADHYFSLDPNRNSSTNFLNQSRYRRASDFTVFAESDPKTIAVIRRARYYNYKIDFSHFGFTGKTVHLTDAAGNDLTGKVGVEVGTGSPGSIDSWFSLRFYDDGTTPSPGKLIDYNPVYVRVDGATSNIGFKIYHEAVRPELSIMTPLVNVDNPNPAKPGHWPSVRQDYVMYNGGFVAFTESNTFDGYNTNGVPNSGVISRWVKVYDDAAVFNIAKNGRHLNFIGTVNMTGYDNNFTTEPDDKDFNRRVLHYAINDNSDDDRLTMDIYSGDYRTGISGFAFQIGEMHDSTNYNPQINYRYFSTAHPEQDTAVQYGPYNGVTEWQQTMNISQNQGYYAYNILTLDGYPHRTTAFTPYQFELRGKPDEGQQLFSNGFDRESMNGGYELIGYQKSYGHWNYNQMHWQGPNNSLTRNPPYFAAYWPTNIRNDSNKRTYMTWDYRGGKNGLWFSDMQFYGNQNYQYEYGNEVDYVRGRSLGMSNLDERDIRNDKLQVQDSPFLNSTFLSSRWGQGNNSWKNIYNQPPWMYRALSLSDTARQADQSSPYVLTWMDVEDTSHVSDLEKRKYSVKVKKFDGQNYHTNSFAYAQHFPVSNYVWTGNKLAVNPGFISAYWDSGSGTVQQSVVMFENPLSRQLASVRSVRYVDNGNKLAVLVSGLISSRSGTSVGLPGWTMLLYDLDTPYSIEGATVGQNNFMYHFNGAFQARSWWQGTGSGLMQLYGSEFYWKPDGTKFWVIGVESSAASYPIRYTNIETRLREFTCTTPWDMSTCSYTTESQFDNLAYSSDYDFECPSDFTFSQDGNKIYWSTYNPNRPTSEKFNLDHFEADLSAQWNPFTAQGSTITPVVIQGFSGNRVQVGTKWYAEDGAAQKIRFINPERWYRTNLASYESKTQNTTRYTYYTGTTFPFGGASVFDQDRSTQKVAGTFSFGNMGMFPYVERNGQELGRPGYDYFQEGPRSLNTQTDIFSFDVNPLEDKAIICDGQTVIYELKFNNDLKGFG